ncbi:amidohydrolase family protein [Nocardia sp. NPDC127606]|uniref:amidohydrolase family protein n=1 Tax=Nocardia sp. NPDC127606 TaxID=3345406 RepID=UPI00362ED243
MSRSGPRRGLIRGATVFGRSCTDVRWSDGRITACGTGLRAEPGEPVLEAGGGWLLPGLHDHHVHLRALAARAGSVPLGPPGIRGREGFEAAVHQACARLPRAGWLRGVGYHESVAGPLDRDVLDRVAPDRAVRVQHRSGALWMLNSAGCRAVGVDSCSLPGVERDAAGRATGRLWRMDGWLGARVGAGPVDLRAIGADAAAAGVTGFTDATPDLTVEAIDSMATDIADGALLQRVHCMAPPHIPHRTALRFTLGPTKILLDDTDLPTLPDFIARIRAAHAAGRPVAVHCVTPVQLVLTIAAIDEAGVLLGDRIEHGAMIPADTLPWLRRTAITVVTQPHFPVERAAQYAAEVDPADRADLWRLGSLIAAGVGVAGGTDAPFGDADPWAVIRAATEHTDPERISLTAAVGLFLGEPEHPARPRRITVGAPANLTLLRLPPQDITEPHRDLVGATVIDGDVVFTA